MNKAQVIVTELTPKQVEEYLSLTPCGRDKHFAASLVYGKPQKKVTSEELETIKHADYQTPERQRETRVAHPGGKGQVVTKKTGVIVHELSIRVPQEIADALSKKKAIEKVSEGEKIVKYAIKAKAEAPAVDEVAELKKKVKELEAQLKTKDADRGEGDE